MRIDLRLGRWQDALADVGECDAVICDPPYSERTHRGHNSGPTTGHAFPPTGGSGLWFASGETRKTIDYDPLSDCDARALVESLAPRVRGWICILTDHLLVPVFTEALEAVDRYVFSPLACVNPGSRVRLPGDGPSQWSVWLVVARPRTREWQRWGALRGAYIRDVPGEKLAIMGGKPLWLMKSIIADYTREGDLVVDPFAGSGTTAIACHRLGRSCITSEMDPATFAMARARIDLELAQGLLFDEEKSR